MIKITFENSLGETKIYYTLDKKSPGEIQTINIESFEGFTGFINEYITNKSPGQIGENIVGSIYNRRDLRVVLRLDYDSHEKTRDISRNIKDFFKSRPILTTIDDGTIQRKIETQVRRMPLIENQRIRGRSSLNISLIAPMPYFENAVPDILEIASTTSLLIMNTELQDEPGDFINNDEIQPDGVIFSSIDNELLYDNDGEAVTPILARINGPAITPLLQRTYIDDEGDTITSKLSFNLTVQADEYVIVNTDNQTAVLYSDVDDSVINKNLNGFLVERDYFKLVQGENTISFGSDGGAPTVRIEINKRYEDAY